MVLVEESEELPDGHFCISVAVQDENRRTRITV